MRCTDPHRGGAVRSEMRSAANAARSEAKITAADPGGAGLGAAVPDEDDGVAAAAGGVARSGAPACGGRTGRGAVAAGVEAVVTTAGRAAPARTGVDAAGVAVRAG